MLLSGPSSKQTVFFLLVLFSILILSYTLQRMLPTVTVFRGRHEHTTQDAAETGLAPCPHSLGNGMGQADDGVSCQTRIRQRKQDQEVQAILARLDRMMPRVTFTDIRTTTSAKNSRATLLNPRGSYCVGDHLLVRLDLYDHLGKRKEYGGDFLRVRIHCPRLQAGAAGHITDYGNGTYLVNFTLFWEGTANVSLLLIHPSEGVSALWAARKKGFDKIAFKGQFQDAMGSVFTECGFNISTRAEELCEYRDKRDQEAFYCVKPRSMPCEAFVLLQSQNKPISYLTPLEQRLLKESNIGVEIPAHFEDIHVLTCNRSATMPRGKCRIGPGLPPVPSGHALRNVWHPEFCSVSDFNTLDTIRACLKGKMVYLMGDSTLRQWIYCLTEKVPRTEIWPRVHCRVGMSPLPVPSGFVWQDRWHPVFCRLSSFRTSDQISICLQGKLVYFMGDSTVRRWMEYLTNTVRTLKIFDAHGSGKLRNLLAVDMTRNTQVQWKKHGHPFVTAHTYTVKDHSYVSREMDLVAGDRNTTVVVALGRHFRPFPIELFVRRILNVRGAIQRLLLRSPDTRVVIKAEDTQETHTDPERFSDFHGYAQYLAAKDLFQGLQVGFVDAWDMTTASTMTDHIVGNQVNMFLSYIC